MTSLELSLPSDWQDQAAIRLARRDDLPAMEWEGDYTHFRRVYASAYERFRRGQALLWVVDCNLGYLLGQVFVQLGVLTASPPDGSRGALIHSFRVRPACRGKGLGTRLLAHAEGDLRRRGYQWAFLNVANENVAAIRLYERLGYQRQMPISGSWSYEDHNGKIQHVLEPGWRMAKELG